MKVKVLRAQQSDNIFCANMLVESKEEIVLATGAGNNQYTFSGVCLVQKEIPEEIIHTHDRGKHKRTFLKSEFHLFSGKLELSQ